MPRRAIKEGTALMSVLVIHVSQSGAMNKLDCFNRFDEVCFWQSRTRVRIANFETCLYSAFQETFQDLRRESRKSEFALVIELYQFQHELEERATDANN